jgi:hypothetical protein
MTMRRLEIVGERTGRHVGWIQLAGEGAEFSDTDSEKLFRSVQSCGDWTDKETFTRLATGWSNGYLTISAPAPDAGR